MSPDPYRATTRVVDNPAHPGSWNRYAYVEGDPTTFRDSAGLQVEAPTGWCPPEYTYAECYGYDWDGGVPSGGSGYVTRPKDAKDPAEWDRLIAATAAAVAAARAAAQQDGIRHYPRTLRVVEDCYIPGSREGGSAFRKRSYQLLDENGDPLSGPVVVTERISLLPGSDSLAPRSYPGIWYGGAVNDRLNRGSGGNVMEIQQFVGLIYGGINVFPAGLGPVPLIIREINGFEHGTLGINMYNNRVEISDVADVGDCK